MFRTSRPIWIRSFRIRDMRTLKSVSGGPCTSLEASHTVEAEYRTLSPFLNG